MKSSNQNQETMVSENLEQTLRDWKLPPSSGSDIFGRRNCSCFFPDCRVNTVEKEIPLRGEGFATIPLFSKYRKRVHQIFHGGGYLHVGMIQVALKPNILGSNTSATITLCDKRLNDPASELGMVESSLCDGPIYFSYVPTYCVALCDSSNTFSIDVETEGDESITLMYRFHYKVVKRGYIVDFSSCFPVDERGKIIVHPTNISQSDRGLSKTVSWDQIGASSGDANVDWKETVKAHVLKVDVPGFKKEEIKVEVEGGRVLQISGERSNEEELEESDKWHCEERSSGKFLRRFRLPENANLDEVKAAVENGVLTLTVPKEEVDKKMEVKVIHISG